MASKRAALIRMLLRQVRRNAKSEKYDPKAMRRKLDRLARLAAPRSYAHMKPAKIPGVSAYWITPPGVSQQRTIIYLHGGGFVHGSTRVYLQHIIRTAKMCNAQVLSIDYPLAPEHPYPAALDNIVKAWMYLLSQNSVDPKQTVFMGESAGGSLALGSSLRLRDANLALPGAIVLLSPALDMSLTGESMASREKRELILSRQKIEWYADMYVGKALRTGPYISPVTANLHDLPPLLVHVGTEEMLYSDSSTIAEHAKRDGVACELFAGEGMWHGWHVTAGFVPEAKHAMRLVAEFVNKTIA